MLKHPWTGRAGAILMSLSLTGCGGAGLGAADQHAALGKSRLQRETLLTRQWRGRSYAELKKTFGEPALTMDILGRGGATWAAVYGMVDPTSGCVDSFTIVQSGGEPAQVEDYFCR